MGKFKDFITEQQRLVSEAAKKFSADQIEQLRQGYEKIDRVDPDGAAYKGIIKLLDSLPPEQLKQLANAKIKFVSSLALNRVHRAKREDVESEALEFVLQEYLEHGPLEFEDFLDEAAKAKLSPAQQKEAETGNHLGREAFKLGMKGIPAIDKNLMGMLKDREVGSSHHILDGWIKGWHEENLKAPVIPKDKQASDKKGK